jgi:hypothetical protein|tara:strand:+ start:21 stop:266 length:246 start_codon:yes stop_codon:yes gene_type:complete
MSINLNDLPFDFEVSEDDLIIDKKAKKAATKDLKENWVTAGSNEDMDDEFVSTYFRDNNFIDSSPMNDVAEWDDFEIDFMD